MQSNSAAAAESQLYKPTAKLRATATWHVGVLTYRRIRDPKCSISNGKSNLPVRVILRALNQDDRNSMHSSIFLAQGFDLLKAMQAGSWKTLAMPARYGERPCAERSVARKLVSILLKRQFRQIAIAT